MNSATRVGALIVVFAGLSYGALSVLGKGMFGTKAKTFYVSMADAGGIAPGTRVLMAGVQVGTVKSVSLSSPTEAKLTLAVKEEINIPSGSVAELPTSLTGLGDSLLTLVPPKTVSTNLQPGETILGRKAKALDSILPNGEAAVTELTKTIAAFRKVLEDKELFGEIKSLMASTNKTMQSFGETASSVNGLIVSNRKSLDASLKQAALTMGNIQSMTRELAAMLEDGKIQGNTTAILENLNSTTKKVDKLMTDINGIVGDPELKNALMATTKNVATMTDSGTRIAVSGEKIASNIGVMTDDGKVITQKTIVLMDKINEIATKASEIEDQIKGTIKKVGGVLDKPGTNPLEGATTRMDLLRESEPNYFRTDFTLNIPRKDGSLSVGVFDAFYSNRLTLQYGTNLNDRLGYRYGIFASRPAFGVDYRIGPKTSWRGDFWDINDPRFDFRFSHEISKGIVGWFGMDRVFRDNAPMIGIGIVK